MRRATGHLFLRGERWYLQYQAAGGERRTVALHTASEPEARQRAARITGVAAAASGEVDYLQGLIELGEWARRRQGSAGGEDLPPGELQARWVDSLSREPRPRTMETYRQQLGRFAAWCEARGIVSARAVSPAIAAEYVREIGKGKATPGRDAALLRRVWRDLGLGGAWAGVKGPKAAGGRFRRLTVQEARQVWETARHGGNRPWRSREGIVRKRFTANPDLADLVLLGWSTGLRRGDAAGLRGDQFDAAAVALRLIAGKTRGRGGRPLTIPLPEEAAAMVRRRIAARGSGPLFGKFGRESLFGLWEASGVLDSGMGRASFHSLRATYISMMDEAGVPPHVTDAITGHAPQGMHGRYTQPGLEAMREAVGRAIPALGID
jgi:integrase